MCIRYSKFDGRDDRDHPLPETVPPLLSKKERLVKWLEILCVSQQPYGFVRSFDPRGH